uniref:Uncharacterized protein n=1 Tax=Anguilla anguilla TaxID=7936 RepID=A0A0E9RGL7_ANGAN
MAGGFGHLGSSVIAGAVHFIITTNMKIMPMYDFYPLLFRRRNSTVIRFKCGPIRRLSLITAD